MRFKLYGVLVLLLLPIVVVAQTVPIAPPQLAATAYVLVDASTGQILAEKNADEQLPPASLTKMMTGYIAAYEIAKGAISMDDQVYISEKAWRKGGSKMFVKVDTEVALSDLLKGIIIQSGNDASIAVAEYIGGTEENFAQMMNEHAERLGMTKTTFKNATGWPEEGHVTTPRDLSLLARSLIKDYPKHYSTYAEKYYTYNEIEQPNRNRLLWRDSSVDGIKTGHTEEAGYCLVASSVKQGMRLISVVMGTKSDAARTSESQKLLNYGFRHYASVPVYGVDSHVETVPVWAGESDQVTLLPQREVGVVIPRAERNNIQVDVAVDEYIRAPIQQGQVLGTVTVTLHDKSLAEVPLVAAEEVPDAGFFARVWASIKLFFLRLFS